MDQPSPSEPMQAVIARAYKVFGRYRLNGSIVVCSCNCCMTPEDQRRLIGTPLRSIPSNLLAEYTNSAHGWDDDKIANDMRCLLPRYLELIAADDAPDSFGIDICLRRMAPARWRENWPPAESDVLDQFFDALMVQSLQRLELARWPVGWRLGFDIKDVLTLAITAGADIGRVLRAWDAAPDPGAAIHMAGARGDIAMPHGEWSLHSAYLEGSHRAEAALIGAFLMRPETAARLEAAFFTIDDPRLQQIVSDSLFV